jgi:hypothetical protein
MIRRPAAGSQPVRRIWIYEHRPDADLKRRLMALFLLHRVSDLFARSALKAGNKSRPLRIAGFALADLSRCDENAQ